MHATFATGSLSLGPVSPLPSRTHSRSCSQYPTVIARLAALVPVLPAPFFFFVNSSSRVMRRTTTLPGLGRVHPLAPVYPLGQE